jgi:hypothetical protein
MTQPNRDDEAWTGLPASLAARPRVRRRGLPIPPINVHSDPDTGEDAVDFTNINTTISTDLAANRRCSLCGVEMGYWVAFLGGPRAAELMRYTDPPGCPDCLRSAVRLCPFIAIERHRRARADRLGAGMIPPGSHGEKSDRWLARYHPPVPDCVHPGAWFHRVLAGAVPYGRDVRVRR